MSLRKLLLVLTCSALSTVAHSAQSPAGVDSASFQPALVYETGETTGLVPVNSAAFGYALDASGQRALVGEPFNGPAGRAHVLVHEPTGWSVEAELTSHDGLPNDFFGAAVALDGDTAVVGAYGVDPGFRGAAYVYERLGGAWIETAKLQSSNGTASDFFGLSVAIDGERIAVAAPDHAGGAFLSGAVYVFVRQGATWVEEAYLVGAPADQGRRIGLSLALEGDTLVAGGPCDVSGLHFAGCAFLWTRTPTGWVQQQKLVASDPTADAEFAGSLSLQGERLAAGAPVAPGGGAAYLFERTGGTWNEVAKLAPGQRWAGELFGRRVDLAGELLLIGGSSSSALFGQRAGKWLERTLLIPSQWPGSYAWGGVALAQGSALIGVPGATAQSQPQCGVVLDFDLESQGWPLGQRYCDPAVPNSSAAPGVLVVAGSTSVAEDSLSLSASYLPAGQQGVFLCSPFQGVVQPASAVGPLCISGPLMIRIAASVQASSGFGTLYHELGTQNVPLVGAFQPGETWNFQVWYRDSDIGQTNLTDAVELAFH